MVTEGTKGVVAASNADYVTRPGNFLQAEFDGSFEVEILSASDEDALRKTVLSFVSFEKCKPGHLKVAVTLEIQRTR